jgi:hypothetical protein
MIPTNGIFLTNLAILIPTKAIFDIRPCPALPGPARKGGF